MVNVRRCNPDDVDWLLDQAVEFNDKLFGIPLNLDRSWDYLHSMVVSPVGACYRTDNAAIVGFMAPDPFRDWSVLVEIGWYSNAPKEGIAVLDEFIKLGKSRYVNEVRMTTLHSNPGVAAVLQRKGFVPVETSHRLIM